MAGAIESALAEARQAILALRPAEGGSFAEVVQRYVADFSDRFGIPAECRCDAAADRLSPRAQAELLRIVQEALANVRKHADATLVRVELTEAGEGLELRVTDNGRVRHGPGGPRRVWSIEHGAACRHHRRQPDDRFARAGRHARTGRRCRWRRKGRRSHERAAPPG